MTCIHIQEFYGEEFRATIMKQITVGWYNRKDQVIKCRLYNSCVCIQRLLMKHQEPSREEKVIEDHQCSICLSVFYKPLRLAKCKHLFCESCLTDAALITENRRCPLCRTEFAQHEIKTEHHLWKELQARYPHSIEERKKIIKERVLARFLVGNTTQFLQVNENNKYRWTFFLKPVPGDKALSEYIQRIDIKLHPTFNPAIISFPLADNRTVQLSRIGWGTFRIGIEIFWKELYQESKSEIYHDLEFLPSVEKMVHTSLTLR